MQRQSIGDSAKDLEDAKQTGSCKGTKWKLGERSKSGILARKCEDATCCVLMSSTASTRLGVAARAAKNYVGAWARDTTRDGANQCRKFVRAQNPLRATASKISSSSHYASIRQCSSLFHHTWLWLSVRSWPCYRLMRTAISRRGDKVNDNWVPLRTGRV